MSGALEQHTSWSSKCTVSACYSNENFSVLYYNARCLLPKMDDSAAVCFTCNPDVIYIVELWLCADITDDEITLPNYSIVRLDRNRHGAGNVMYIKENLHVSWCYSY